MSKIVLQPNSNGTGVFTLEAPVSNNNRSINLPDESGTLVQDPSSLPLYFCRAWVNFDGGGTVSIRESGNVSSITDNGTGRYLVNFTTAMPDSNFSVSLTGGAGSCESNRVQGGISPSTVETLFVNQNGSPENGNFLSCIIFR